MGTVSLLARLVLASVFAVAGIAKIADRAGSRQAIIDFGLPKVLATPLGILLPLTEILIAAALLPVATAWVGAFGAIALLTLFVIGISVNLAHGRQPDCHCFGQLHSAPLSWATLACNSLLIAIAGYVVWNGPAYVGPSAVQWLTALTIVQMVELVGGSTILALLGVQGWAILQLLRQNGRLLLRIEALEGKLPTGSNVPVPTSASTTQGLPIGTPAPRFSLSGLNGEMTSQETLRAAGKPVVVVFSDPGCGPCNALLPDLARWQRNYAMKLTISVVSRGTLEANRAKSTEHGLTHVLLQNDREVAELYKAHGTPIGVLIRPDGTIGSELAAGADAIRKLIAQTAETIIPVLAINGKKDSSSARDTANGQGMQRSPTQTLQIGEPAPTLRPPDLGGKMIDLSVFRGSPTLLLFWNPACGFCQRMVDDLMLWEANRPQDAPKLLVISSGSVEANQAMGLASPVLLDQTFTAGQRFAANGTPMAVLIDANGYIASNMVAGAPAVLALANEPYQAKVALPQTR